MEEIITSKEKRISFPVKIAYGLGGSGDTVTYNLFYIYFLYFLTDIAKVNPAISGTISLIAVCWCAVLNPIIGTLSDNCKSKHGRRISFMAASIIPEALMVALMFANVNLSPTLKVAYYIVICILLWTSYTCYVMPYFALGAEITSDYKERNTIRTITMIIGLALGLLCTSGPMWIVDFVSKKGGTEQQAWGYTGIIFGIIIFVACSVCIIVNRKRDIVVLQDTLKEKKENLLITIGALMKIKAYRIVCLLVALFGIGVATISSSIVYILNYITQLDPGKQATFWMIYVATNIAVLPFVNFFCNKFGKKETLIFMMSLAIVNGVAFSFIGLHTFALLIVFNLSASSAASTFFTLYLVLAYDCCAIDEYRTGKKREGIIISIVSFLQITGAAVAMWMVGMLLNLFGYNGAAETQTAQALGMILKLGTLIPALFFAIALIVFIRYPVRMKDYNALTAAIEKRSAGEPYDESEFKHIIK